MPEDLVESVLLRAEGEARLAYATASKVDTDDRRHEWILIRDLDLTAGDSRVIDDTGPEGGQ